jgi:two-component system response regulator CpxR
MTEHATHISTKFPFRLVAGRLRIENMLDVPPTRRSRTQSQFLLVDDDVSLGKLVVEYAAYEGYAVAVTTTGEAGLRMAATRTFALVVLDVMLPGIDGFEVLERLRHFSNVPVLMLTTRGTAADRVRGLRMGADDYLPKPFEPAELIARFQSILRRVQPSMNGLAYISIDDIELDERSRRVTCAGAAVELTATEFSLLQVLLSSAGTVLPRQDLIPRVLSRRESAIDRGIDSLVSNLRRKLGPLQDGGERIRSVRGVGYVYVIGNPEKAN